MTNDIKNHPAVVDAWLKRAQKEVGPDGLLELFERAVHELWACAHETLSEITLRAIFDRVLSNASERYPMVASLKVSDAGVSFADFKPVQQAESLELRELDEAFRFVIVEFLAITGSLTDQVITPALHARLAKINSEEKVLK